VRRIPWQLVAAILLLVALGVLGTLQYRWLGAVSEAERERMRTSLRARATDISQEVNGELTRIYAAFRADTAGLDAEPAKAIANAYSRWRESAQHPDLVKAIYLIEGGDASAQPRRFDTASRFLVPTEWPPELKGVLQHPAGPPPVANLPTPMFLVDSVNAQIPALVIAVPRITRNADSGQVTVITDPVAIARSIVIVLDNDRLIHEVVAPAVAKQFGDADASDYFVTIVKRDDQASVVYKTGATEVSAATADVVVGLFDLRMEELARMAEGRGGFLPRLRTSERVAITIVRKGGSTDGRHMIAATTDEQGAWQLRARYRSGSLDSIVAASRRRNIAVGLGVLSLLAASVGLVIVSAQRQQRLARQQMEFVAAVSHELRTPLAVICSAGENLADGVVSDPAQIKRYGSLVETEGRRLGAMVERVLDFAGISSGNGLSRGDVNVASVIADAVRGVDADARDRGVTIAVHDVPDPPHVTGDADALRSAVQNVVGNAVKYSPRGASVDVATETHDSTVRIRVADRGLGIDAEDLPHIFKPFYRGRRAIDAEVRGSGVGLSVVRHVVDAHHGKIHVDSRPGEGTTVIVDLPAGKAVVGSAFRRTDEVGPADAGPHS
jgi:signal transduction histidine kinase